MPRPVRSVFVSDVHLGCRFSQADAFLAFLNRYEPENVYLVGDFVDGWKLRRRWHWPRVYTSILRRLMELSKRGAIIRYVAGNHDAFLRELIDRNEVFEIGNSFIHETPHKMRFLVIHGDQFDAIEQKAPWLSHMSSVVYDGLLALNVVGNLLRRRPRTAGYGLCGLLKRNVKWLVRFFSQFERQLSDAARRIGCEGVICGHIHSPAIRDGGDFVYLNTGDWVEHGSALIEHHDGTIELELMHSNRREWFAPHDRFRGESVAACEDRFVSSREVDHNDQLVAMNCSS